MEFYLAHSIALIYSDSDIFRFRSDSGVSPAPTVKPSDTVVLLDIIHPIPKVVIQFPGTYHLESYVYNILFDGT